MASRLTGDGKAKLVGVVCEETLEEGALADARGSRDDERAQKVGQRRHNEDEERVEMKLELV